MFEGWWALLRHPGQIFRRPSVGDQSDWIVLGQNRALATGESTAQARDQEVAREEPSTSTVDESRDPEMTDISLQERGMEVEKRKSVRDEAEILV